MNNYFFTEFVILFFYGISLLFCKKERNALQRKKKLVPQMIHCKKEKTVPQMIQSLNQTAAAVVRDRRLLSSI